MMNSPKPPFHAYQSFLIRMWRRSTDEESLLAWEGDLHHLQENRVYMFHGIGELVEHLLRIVSHSNEEEETSK